MDVIRHKIGQPLMIMAARPIESIDPSTAPSGHTRLYTFGDVGAPFTSSGGRSTTAAGRTTFPVVTPSSTRIDFVWRVETDVDSDSVAFLLDSATADGYRFIVDGQYVSATGTASAAGSQRYYRLQWPTKARRRVVVEGNRTLGFWGSAVPDDGQCLLPSDTDALRMFFVGDSNPYLEGFPQKGDSYALALGDFLGIRDTWVNAISSTGFVIAGGGNNYGGRRADWTTLPADSIDLIVFQMSYNDWSGGVDDATLGAAITAELTQARAAHPNAVILIHGNNDWNESGGSPPGLTQDEVVAANAVTAFNDPLVRFLPIYTEPGLTRPITGETAPGDTGTGNTPRYASHSQFHMSPAGNIYFGEWLARRFIPLLASMAGVPVPAIDPPQSPVESAAGMPTFITMVKAADESRANATLATDATLQSALEPNSVYRFELMLMFTGGTAEDFRFRISRTGLSDAELRYAGDLDNNSAPTLTWDATTNCAVAAAGTLYIGNYIGVLRTGTNAGTALFQWAQQVAGANAAVLKAGSMLMLRKVA